MKITNPATGEVLAEREMDTAESVRARYQELRKGANTWREWPLRERVGCIEKFSQLLREGEKELTQTLTAEVGKPIKQSLGELQGARGRIEYFVEQAERWLCTRQVNNDGQTEEMLVFEPLGVVANISAWNYPYLVGVNVIVPALIAGNAILYKPSEYATLTGLYIQQLLHDAGVPKDVFVAVVGDGRVGQYLTDLPLDGYFFTGSVTTGRKIATAVAAKLVPVGLELGGKDPLYVTDDVSDVTGAADSCVDGCFYNNGQSCCAVERVYVHEKVYKPFLEAFVAKVKTLKVGDPTAETTEQGPVTRPQQIQFLQEHVEDAVKKGAQIVLGGKPHATLQNAFEPTVLVSVDHSMQVMREETFGPVVGIQRVRDDDEAVELMNDTDYGLTAAVYCSNQERAQNILRRLDVGTAYVNCCDRVSPHLPWSGQRDSGLGATLSYLGILAFVHPKGYHLRA